ncbi:uncharacterized protein IL334_007152 [Kwoniella shivajii]|uniref:THO complex subunit 5 n=1 Tax=Kwoniella shivajii TaxID=564305 RepID=A0ABZ1D8D3_9TREE|nr:hypothetical protein IL334_007152 [Kwoniella shivajii]
MVLPKTICPPSPLDPLLLLPIPTTLPSSPIGDLDPLLSSLQSHLDSSSDSHIPITALTSTIRQITRKSQILLNAARAGAAQARDELDKVDEELRGVEYERARVGDEILRCSEYAPAYEEMDLPSPEDFLAQADESVLKTLPSKDSEDYEHELTIARLEQELKEIEKREVQVAQLTKDRDILIRTKKEIKLRFDAVDIHLGGFARSANAVASKLKDVAELPTSAPVIAGSPLSVSQELATSTST